MSNVVKQFNFTEEQVAKLLKMQDELNTYIHPDWQSQDFDWYEAITDECGEIKGHLGWKWWKPGYQCGITPENKDQIKLEVIDILHFLLSGMITYGHNGANVATIFNGSALPDYYTLDTAVSQARRLACDGYYPAVQWSWMALLVELTEQEVIETYTQKYVLNKFRQDHGYKDGSYVKVWEHRDSNPPEGSFGICTIKREDNLALEHVVCELKLGNHDITDETLLYSELERLYNSRLNK